MGWLRRKLGGADHAADLAQDTFVRVLAAQAEQRALVLREPRAYLTTVARNLLINHVQRLSLEKAWLDAMAQLPEPLAPSPEQQLLVLESLHQVDAMLNGLPPKVREAFLLSQLDGLSYAQVAERLGVTSRTVKRYMAQAFEQCILLVI
ncbi:RNA polymerase, sigma-24 subunit, ECF subfamily protein [Comamonas thiooxydans]|nr:RNA polymerase, sigma-24 subunit, ECF subfamily protein [Comamonas thiooxydans]